MSGKLLTYGFICLAAIAIWMGWKLTSRDAYETAEYRVLKSESPFELREYSELMLAATQMKSDRFSDANPPGNDGSFGRLFNFISGGNEQKKKIAMTTPVFMGTDAEKERPHMGFVIPREVAKSVVPKPTNQQVKINLRPGGKFAVVRFAGRMSDQSIEKQRRELLAWIEDQGLVVAGSAELAGYDPPWKPGMFRRNEILMRVQ